MSDSRRDFLKKMGLSLAMLDQIKAQAGMTPPAQRFNMSGYAAPKLDTVRIGFVGIGNRGYGAVERMTRIEGVQIKALCDLRPERVRLAQQLVDGAGHRPALYSGSAESWKKVCERDDLDLIYILTPWALHTPIAVFSMNHGKHVCVEVPAAKTIEEAWQLVEASERTRKHCMMVEN